MQIIMWRERFWYYAAAPHPVHIEYCEEPK